MTKSPSIRLGAVTLDTHDYASQGNAVLGIRDSGKSYTATYIAERLMEAGVPIIAFDPIGLWRFLRVGAGDVGFPVVVAGGEHGDLPLTPASAPEIVRAAMRDGISLVIDLYSMELSKADWKRIVASCVRALLYENKQYGLRHVFIEEAAEFVPQMLGRGDADPKVYAEIEKLARMGGNALLGYTLINQRAEEVNKAVLELCDNLILHRQKGKNSLASLTKWLDLGAKGGASEIIKSLPMLPQGEAWVWAGGTDTPVHVKVPKKKTFHPDRRATRSGSVAPSAQKAVDVSSFVEKMQDNLAKSAAAAKAPAPKAAPIVAPTAPAVDVRAIERGAYDRGKIAGEVSAINSLRPILNRVNDIASRAHSVAAALQAVIDGPPTTAVPAPAVSNAPAPRAPMAPSRPTVDSTATPMSKAERALLTAIVQFPGSSREKVGIIAGYSPSSGHFDNTLGALRSKGWVEKSTPLMSTQAGVDALGHYEPIPTGRPLLDHWLTKLGKAERSMLSALYEAGTGGLSRDELGTMSGYSPSSGHFDNCLGKLRTLELASRGNPIVISEAFYG